MKVYTSSIGNWRKTQATGILTFDVTVKSGDKLLAPDWDTLMGYKRTLDEEEYTKKFMQKMRESYRDNKIHWLGYCYLKEVIFTCYCGKNCFCHRHLLVDIFEKICKDQHIKFERMGEL